MTSSAELQFDKMEVDTKLAQEYMEKNNSEFRSIGMPNTDEFVHDAANNKIYCSIYSSELHVSEEKIKQSHYFTNLWKLANSIEKNKNLFCQLEYLIRHKPIQITKLEVNMIVKYIRYLASLSTNTVGARKVFVVKDDTPIIDLGYMCQFVPAVDLLASKNMAVVCYLFTSLCQTSGSNSVNLGFIKNDDIEIEKNIKNYTNITKSKVVNGGCIGVVTTKSDIESAVNVFLSTAQGDIWGIRRILVQESASARLKTEFAWKTRSGSQDIVDSKLKSLCTNVYVYEGKIFVGEYVGSHTSFPNVVVIEAFRTVKELLTLVESYSPFCVSLWSDSVAESNEITFGISASMVWINRYGTVGLPFQVSLAYYSQLGLNKCKDSQELDRVKVLLKDWLKLTYSERRKILVTKVLSVDNDDTIQFLLSSICTYEGHANNFVHVGDTNLVIGVHKQRDVYLIQLKNMFNVLEFLKGLVGGSGFLIKKSQFQNLSLKSLMEVLVESEVPVRFTESDISFDSFPLSHTTRIVHSGFGTIFAN